MKANHGGSALFILPFIYFFLTGCLLTRAPLLIQLHCYFDLTKWIFVTMQETLSLGDEYMRG